MPIEENELFRMISLRRPDDHRTIDPSNDQQDSKVLKSLRGQTVNPYDPSSKVLEIIARIETSSEDQLRGTLLGQLEDLPDNQALTLESLEVLPIQVGDRTLPLRQLSATGKFKEVYRQVYDSWILFSLSQAEADQISLRATLLRVAYLVKHLAADRHSLRSPASINQLLHAIILFPKDWEPEEMHLREIQARHEKILDSRSPVDPSQRSTEIARKKKHYQQLVKQIAVAEQLQIHANRLYFRWKSDKVSTDSEHRLQAGTAPIDLDDQFYIQLQDQLNEEQKPVYLDIMKTFPGKTPPKKLSDLLLFLSASEFINLANQECAEIQALEEAELQKLPEVSKKPGNIKPPLLRSIDWGDLVVAREKLVGYQAREIAHIENVLPGENKVRRHERVESTEVVEEFEKIHEEETEKDTQTTDRHELQRESQTAIQQNFAIKAGVNTSGRYGVTKVDTSVEAGLQLSKSDSQSSTQSDAQEIVSKAIERTFDRVREMRRTITKEQIRELNRHGINNTADGTGGSPVPRSGVYLWLEKIHQIELRHYGMRCMAEFHIPEPGLSLLELQTAADKPALSLPPFNVRIEDIQDCNYMCLARTFGALDIQPPPPVYINVGYSWASTPAESAEADNAEDTVAATIAIPEGYRPVTGTAIISAHPQGYDLYLDVSVVVGGKNVIDLDKKNDYAEVEFDLKQDTLIYPWPAGVPVSIRAVGHFDKTLVAQVVLRCERMPEAYNSWKILMWERLRSAYQDRLRELRREREEIRLSENLIGQIEGRPEAENRRIELQELKKWAIKAMRLRNFDFDAVVQEGDFQELDPLDADMQAPIAGFFEGAFEWQHASYVLYPYFWGRRDSWKMRLNAHSSDVKHLAFLQAGAARLIVPITPGYEERVQYYVNPRAPKSELKRINHPPGGPMPPGTLFKNLWLELRREREADLALGTGTLTVQENSDKVTINLDSNWVVSERDMGRHLHIGGERYTIREITPERELQIDRPYTGVSDSKAVYATGSVPYGQPWLVTVPTSLVILLDNRDALQQFPGGSMDVQDA